MAHDLKNSGESNQENCIVFTGAPCSGKTSTLRLLQQSGFGICDEAADLYVVNELNKGKTIEDILADRLSLEIGVTRLALIREAGIAPDALHFLDRSAIDSVGYSRTYNIDPIPFESEIRNKRYNPNVFFFDRLGLLNNRLERSEIEVLELEGQLEAAYKELGYEIIRVPLMSVRHRAWFILTEIQKRITDVKFGEALSRRLGISEALRLNYENFQFYAPNRRFDEQSDELLRVKASREGISGININIIVVNDKNHILFLKRALHDSHAPGSIGLPGGTREPEESLIITMEREMKEETGIQASEELYLVGSYDIASETATWRSFTFLNKIQGSEVLLDPEEHSGYFWENFSDEKMLLRTELHSPGEMIMIHNTQANLLAKRLIV